MTNVRNGEDKIYPFMVWGKEEDDKQDFKLELNKLF